MDAMTGGGIAAFGVMAMFLFNAFKNEDEAAPEPEHGNVHGGSAVAATVDEVLAQGLSCKSPGGFFIAAVRSLKDTAVHWLRYQKELGCLVFGGPGTGKGVGFVIPTILDRDKTTPESLLVFDPAAQNIEVTGPYLQSVGYRVVYSSLVAEHAATLREKFGPPLSMNALATVDLNDPLAEVTITHMAGVLVPVQADAKNSYFSGSAQNLVASTGIWLRETDANASWPKVAELLHGSAWDMNQMFAAMKQSRNAKVRATANQWFREIDPETKKLQGNPTEGMRDVLSTARRELEFLLNGAISDMFSGAFDFATMKRERTAYFLILPDGESESVKKCAYLVLQTAKQALMTPGGFSILWLLDEMCAALPSSGADLIKDAAALVRKYRIRIAGICQSWAQLEDWCGNDVKANALRSMFGAAIYYGANDNTSIAHIMRECGQSTIWEPASNPLHAAGLEGNSGPMGVPLFQPEEIRAMIPEQKQIINLIGAKKVCLLPRTSYRTLPELRARAAEDPYHKNQ